MPHQPPHCSVCQHGSRHGESPYCAPCRRLISQALGTGNRTRKAILSAEAQQAIRESLARGEQLYGKRGIFACHYSGILLTTRKSHATRGDYASFDHVIPNDPSRAVLCARVVNNIKGGMTDGEFAEYVQFVLDLPAMRTFPGLTPKQSRRLLAELQRAMYDVESGAVKAHDVLKCLAAMVRYEPKLQKPQAEAPVAEAPVIDETL